MPFFPSLRKLLAALVLGTLMFAMPATVFAATPGAHDSDLPNPCYDMKGAGKDVLVNGVANSGHVDFEMGAPLPLYEGCLRDLSGGAGTGPFRLEGWVWNTTLGWVSLYCPPGANQQNLGIDCTGAYQGGYQVDFDIATGDLKGFAWGDNIGWIAFNTTESQIKAEVTDPQLLGLIYASAPHSAFDTHVWSDNVGWLNFDGVQLLWNGVNPMNPPPPGGGSSGNGSITVEFNPDPSMLNKNNAPVANNGMNSGVPSNDYYQIEVTILDQNGQPMIAPQYQVTFTPQWLDTVKKDQVSPNTVIDNANCNNLGGAVTKPCGNQFTFANGVYISSPITSWAPTSNMNGLDTDLDGTIDFPYETFYSPSNLAGVLQSNDLILTGVAVQVLDMNAGGTCVLGCDGVPLPVSYSGPDPDHNLKFRPSTEVTQLDDPIYFDHINITYGNTYQFPMAVSGNGTVTLSSGIDNSNPPIDPQSIQFLLDSNNDHQLNWSDSNPSGVNSIFWPLAFPAPLSVDVGVFSNPNNPGSPPPQYLAGLYLYSKVADNNGVFYYSNKLPRVTGSSAATPVAVLQGNIYSTGATATTSTVQPIRSLGDVSTNVLRDTIFNNVARIVGGSQPTQGPLTLVPNGQGGFKDSNNATVTGLLPDKNGVPRVYYVKGDVYLGLSGAGGDVTWTGDRTIVTMGGNIYIDQNLYNGASAKSPLGLIALRDLAMPSNKNQGHIYVNVGSSNAPLTNIQAHAFADGSVFPYKSGIALDALTGEPKFGSLANFQSAMNCCQLLWQGTIASENTIGGSTFNPPILGDGTLLSGGTAGEKLRAQLYDLNFLRHYVGLTKQDLYGNYLHANGSAIGALPDKLRLTKNDGTPFSYYDTDPTQPGVSGDLIPPTDSAANGGNPSYYEAAQGLNWQKDLASTVVKYLPVSPNLPGFSKNVGGAQKQLTR